MALAEFRLGRCCERGCVLEKLTRLGGPRLGLVLARDRPTAKGCVVDRGPHLGFERVAPRCEGGDAALDRDVVAVVGGRSALDRVRRSGQRAEREGSERRRDLLVDIAKLDDGVAVGAELGG